MLMTLAGLAASCRAAEGAGPAGDGRDTLAWRDGPPLPEPVQEIYPALHRDAIWLAGGFIAQAGRITGPTAACHRLEKGADAWRSGPSLPRPRHHPHLRSHGGRLYALAGFEATGPGAAWVMQAGGWRLDEVGGDWIAAPTLPAPMGEAVTASLGEGLHIATGRTPRGAANANWNDHVDSGQHFVLTGPDTAWQTAAPCPTPRNSATAEIIDGLWHVVGGRTVDGGNTTAHEVYDPREDRWRRAAPLPQGQGGLASGVLAGKLYAFGGEFFEGEGGVYADCWAYDPARDSWTEAPAMTTPRHGLGGISWQGGIWAIGGAGERGGNATSATVEILGPA